jgi:hypothetical protein
MFVWNGAAAGALLPRVLGAQPAARVYRLGYIGVGGGAGSYSPLTDPMSTRSTSLTLCASSADAGPITETVLTPI